MLFKIVTFEGITLVMNEKVYYTKDIFCKILTKNL